MRDLTIRSWRAGALVAVVLCTVAGVFPAASRAAFVGPLQWSAPATLDTAPASAFVRGLRSVSCASERLCVAADGAGGVVASTSPAGGRSAWHFTHIGQGTIDCGAGERCPAPLSSISCKGRACATADSAGFVYTTVDATTGLWQSQRVAEDALGAVACAHPTACLVADLRGNVLVSTDTTATPQRWAVVRATSATCEQGCAWSRAWISAIDCPTFFLCVAGDQLDNIVGAPRADSTEWAPLFADRSMIPCSIGGSCRSSIRSVSCAGTTFCAASDDANDVITSTTPSRAGSWRKHVVLGGWGSTVACGSTRRCVAVQGGQVYASDAPATNTPWGLTRLRNSGTFTGVSCPSMRLCVAVTDHGELVVGRADLLSPDRVRRALARDLRRRVGEHLSLRRADTYSTTVKSPVSGIVRVRWLAGAGAGAGARTRVLATGRRALVAAGRAVVTLRPTSFGRRQLRSGRRVALTIDVRLTHTPHDLVTASWRTSARLR